MRVPAHRRPKRSAPRPRARRSLIAALAMATLLGVLPSAAGAAEDPRLEQAQARVDEAQAAADAATAAVEAGVVRQAGLQDHIADLRHRIAEGQRQIEALREIVTERAVEVYMGGSVDASTLFAEGDALDLLRRTELVDRANAHEDAAIDLFGAISDELAAQTEQLASDRDELADVLVHLRADQETVQQELYSAYAARQEIETRVAAEEAAARRAAEERARQIAEDAARRAATTSTTVAPGPTEPSPTDGGTTGDTTPSTTPRTTPTTAPSGGGGGGGGGGGSILCPIDGPVSFVDSWHAPRSGGRLHEGVDLMNPKGTPNVAVVSGTITHTTGSLSGYGAFLYGDDGNSYWYFHWSAFAGPERRVARGEVIGYTGDTGNATGIYHTHFEYHPGHGGPVNPYPLVASVC